MDRLLKDFPLNFPINIGNSTNYKAPFLVKKRLFFIKCKKSKKNKDFIWLII
jgi:hypothetical protein